MNGVDYTKRLAQEREYYNESLRKNKEATDKQISHNDERNKYVQKKQLDNFIEDKAEIESNYKNNMETINEKTRELMSNTHSKHHEELEKERHNFITETNENRKEFNQRLDDIRQNYNKNLKSEKELHRDLQTADQKRYKKNIKEMSDDKEQKLSSYQEKLKTSVSELKDDYQDDRRNIEKANDERSIANVRENTVKRAELKDRIDAETKLIKDVHSQELASKQEYFDEKIKDTQGKYKELFDGMTVAHDNANLKVVRSQKEDALKQTRAADEKLSEAQRKFNKELRLKEIEMKRRDTGSGEFAEVMQKQQGSSDKFLMQRKIDNLKNHLKDTQVEYEERSSNEHASNKELLKIKASKQQLVLRESSMK